MADDFLPRGDWPLYEWSSNFSKHIGEMGTEVGITPEMAAEYTELHSRYAAALRASSDPTTRTRGNISTKNDCRKSLKMFARKLARIAQSHPATIDAQRVTLGLSVRQAGGASPAIAAPSSAPITQILYTNGRRLRVRLRRAGTNARGREPGSRTATVFSFVGENVPADIRGWMFEKSLSETVFDIDIVPTVPAGSKVWLAAIWSAPSGERSPVSAPVSTYVGDGVSQAA